MSRTDWLLTVAFVVFGSIMLVEVSRVPQFPSVSANTAHFDYVSIVSPVYLYQGNQGVLLLDKRNGNVWFIGKGTELNGNFRDPVYVTRLPLDKLDQAQH